MMVMNYQQRSPYADDMSLEGPEIGRRVASYRKLNGWSMGELERRTGSQIKRDVIANIETGRKKDLTVRQLIWLAEALDVPPLALLVDLDDVTAPSHVDVIDQDGDRRGLTNLGFIRWFSGTIPLDRDPDESIPSHLHATESLSAIHDLIGKEELFAAALADYAGRTMVGGKAANDYRDYLNSLHEAKERARQRLRSLGVRIEVEGGANGEAADAAE